MRCAKRNWALIYHAGSAPEASIGSKPLGSELGSRHTSIAPECQGFFDGWVARSVGEACRANSIRPAQASELKHRFFGHRVHLANPSLSGARQDQGTAPCIQDTEKHLSQLPALHLLQKMEPRWRRLTREEVERERGGKRANVYLNGILNESLARINRIQIRGQSYPFTENGLAEAIERLKRPRPSGLLRINEELTDLLLLGTAVEQTVDGITRAFQVKFVDWVDPSANMFHVRCEEWMPLITLWSSFDIDGTRDRQV